MKLSAQKACHWMMWYVPIFSTSGGKSLARNVALGTRENNVRALGTAEAPVMTCSSCWRAAFLSVPPSGSQ